MRIAFLGDGSLIHIRRWVGYFNDNGHSVVLISFESIPTCNFDTHRVKCIVPTKLMCYLSSVFKVRSILKSFQPDIVNALYISGYGLLGSLTGYRPFIASALGSDLLVDYQSHLIHRIQIRRVIRKADLITTDAENLSEKAISIGAKPENIIKVYFGIDESIFYQPSDDSRKQNEQRSFDIISTRNFYPVYDLDTLVDAAFSIQRDINVRFILCGEGPERFRLERKVAGKGMNDRIFFTGKLNGEGIAAKLREASVYVSTSVSDSTSVSLLEAMACGTAPVVTDIPANREWVKHGVNGLLFPPRRPEKLAKSIMELYNRRDLIDKFSKENSRIIRERGLWTKNMNRLEEAFMELTGKS